MAAFGEVDQFNSKADKLLGLGKGAEAEIEGQQQGFLYKKPVGRVTKLKAWKKRYFVLKDGFILWYGNKSNSPVFNTKPRGCMPLGGCTIKKHSRDPRIFEVSQQDLGPSATIMARAADEREADLWIHNIEMSRKATWENALLGNALIERMKAAGTAIEKEKAAALEEYQQNALQLKHEQEGKERLLREQEEMQQNHEMMIVSEQEKLKQLETSAEKIGQKLDEEEQARRDAEAKRQSLETRLQQAEKALKKLEIAFTITGKDTAGAAFSDEAEIKASVSVLRKFFEDKQEEQALRARALKERLVS